MKNFGLENLTDKELLGQLLCLEISGCKDRDEIISIIKENKPGAIYVNNFESKEIKEITEIANSVTKYPVLVVADVEHGRCIQGLRCRIAESDGLGCVRR